VGGGGYEDGDRSFGYSVLEGISARRRRRRRRRRTRKGKRRRSDNLLLKFFGCGFFRAYQTWALDEG